MEIRELGEADATEYRELRLRALREHPESFLSSYEAERARPETEVAARLARSAESPDDFILGCYVDDELVGTIGFSRDDREKQRHRGFIWGMHAQDTPLGFPGPPEVKTSDLVLSDRPQLVLLGVHRPILSHDKPAQSPDFGEPPVVPAFLILVARGIALEEVSGSSIRQPQ